MSRENYELFGLSESASMEEVEAKYAELKAKYNEEKWQDGEAGNSAARMLAKLEAAYNEIKEERYRSTRSAGNAYEEITSAIKSGDISRAQQLLDSFNERDAEWHYLQSVVFYRKNWMNESKKQLEIAMQMDPSCAKYKHDYERLKARTEYTAQTGGATGTNPDIASGEEQMGGNVCANCASMCYTFLCVNCLFNLCCGCR